MFHDDHVDPGRLRDVPAVRASQADGLDLVLHLSSGRHRPAAPFDLPEENDGLLSKLPATGTPAADSSVSGKVQLESAILQHFVFTKLRRTSELARNDWIKLQVDKLWLQYQDIRTVVDQANRLLGLVVLLKDGVYFLATCILTYMFFYRLKSSETNLFIVIYKYMDNLLPS